jgi:hypothetical protein
VSTDAIVRGEAEDPGRHDDPKKMPEKTMSSGQYGIGATALARGGERR